MPLSPALFSARLLLDEFARGGARTVCIAPGSRSTPLALAAAEREDLCTRILTDERSMGFFALGLARAGRVPVIVVCTSGTAAANLLPAAIESALGGGALLLLTADRPPEQRERAVPQTIDQQGLFGSHARWATDVPILDTTTRSARQLRSLASRAVALATTDDGGPVHLNVPIREPFADDSFPAPQPPSVAAREAGRPFTGVAGRTALRADDAKAIAGRLRAAKRGVLVAAGRELPASDIAALAAALDWPVLADPLSGLRFGAHDRSRVVDAIEPLLRDERLRDRLRPDAIVRFGLTPPPRSVQTWLDEAWPAEHVVVSDGAWPDPVHAASTIVRTEAAAFCRDVAAACGPPPAHAADWTGLWSALSQEARAQLERGLEDETALFDGVVLRAVAAALPAGSTLVVGNSMPVRDADTFLAADDKPLRVLANRGASGIDGVLSTALGVASASGAPTALVVGDLSFLHDAAALVFAARERIPLAVVVVNNDGGGIFSFLPLHDELAANPAAGDTFERCFATPHGSDLSRVAALTGGFFASVDSRADLKGRVAEAVAAAAEGPALVEVRTDRNAGLLAHRRIVGTARAAAERWLESGTAPEPPRVSPVPRGAPPVQRSGPPAPRGRKTA